MSPVIVVVAQGAGWPYLDDDEIAIVIFLSLAIIAMVLGGVYYLAQQIQGAIADVRARRAKQMKEDREKRAADAAAFEHRQQLRAEGWTDGLEEFTEEQIIEIATRARSVGHKLAAALTRKRPEEQK